MTKKLIAGNWKMNGGLAANEALVQAMLAGIGQPAADVALCVPAPYLAQLQSLLQGSAIAWGSQDVSAHEQGAYTGEVSVAMLKDFGCRYAIVGHSERRQYHGETDEVVAAKAQRALSAGVTPIVCVGETLASIPWVTASPKSWWPTSLSGPSVPARPPHPRWRRPCMPCCAPSWPLRPRTPSGYTSSMAAA